jgi:hypothetical protein
MGMGRDTLLDLLVAPFLVLWLLLPINALISIYRRRRHRSGFAYAVMVLWVASPILPVLRLFLGFGRLEGNSPEAGLVQVTLVLLLVVMTALHIALVITGNDAEKIQSRYLTSERTRVTIRPHIFWALSIVGIPAVYTLGSYFYERFEAKHPGLYLPTTGLDAAFLICIGVGVAALQKQVPADTGASKRVALALAYAGGILVLTGAVTFIVLLYVFGWGSTTW